MSGLLGLFNGRFFGWCCNFGCRLGLACWGLFHGSRLGWRCCLDWRLAGGPIIDVSPGALAFGPDIIGVFEKSALMKAENFIGGKRTEFNEGSTEVMHHNVGGF